MEDVANLGKHQVLDMVKNPGISLFLGYHPRANLDLVLELVILVVKEGLISLVLDCDHTIILDGNRRRMREDEARRILISHPEDRDALLRDLESSCKMDNIGLLVVNRPSSLIEESDNLERFTAKKNLWIRASSYLNAHKERSSIVVLEDSRRYDQVEYKVHPALFYQATLILDSVDKRKDVQKYQILKERPEGA